MGGTPFKKNRAAGDVIGAGIDLSRVGLGEELRGGTCQDLASWRSSGVGRVKRRVRNLVRGKNPEYGRMKCQGNVKR